MARKKSSTERTVYREYQLAVKALKERVRQIRKKGGYVPDVDVAQYTLQYINKSEITEDLISEIKGQYRKDIYRGYVTDPQTGEFLPPSEYEKLVAERLEQQRLLEEQQRLREEHEQQLRDARQRAEQERKYKRSTKKIDASVDKAIEESINYPDYSKMVLARIGEQINRFPSAEGHDALFEFYLRMINKFGKYRTAIMFEAAAAEGLVIDWDMMYHGSYQAFLTNLINYLPDATLDDRETLHNVVEQLNGWEAAV